MKQKPTERQAERREIPAGGSCLGARELYAHSTGIVKRRRDPKTSRPVGMNPQTWRKISRAADCIGESFPPITETYTTRYRSEPGAVSDGIFHRSDGTPEPYSSIFTFSLKQPCPFTGERLSLLGECLCYQGILISAPLLDTAFPYAYAVAFDTEQPLPLEALSRLLTFLQIEDSGGEQPYSFSWARPIRRDAWSRISSRIRLNIRIHSKIAE